MSEPKPEDFFSNTKEYIVLNYEILKLRITEKISVLSGSVISGLLIVLTGLISFLFLSLCAGFYFSSLLGSNTKGFLIVGCSYFLIFLLLFFFGKTLVRNPIRDKIIKELLSKK